MPVGPAPAQPGPGHALPETGHFEETIRKSCLEALEIDRRLEAHDEGDHHGGCGIGIHSAL